MFPHLRTLSNGDLSAEFRTKGAIRACLHVKADSFVRERSLVEYQRSLNELPKNASSREAGREVGGSPRGY